MIGSMASTFHLWVLNIIDNSPKVRPLAWCPVFSPLLFCIIFRAPPTPLVHAMGSDPVYTTAHSPSVANTDGSATVRIRISLLFFFLLSFACLKFLHFLSLSSSAHYYKFLGDLSFSSCNTKTVFYACLSVHN